MKKTISRPPRRLVRTLVLVSLCAATYPALAAGWRFAGGEAGLWVDGGFNGLAVGCRGGALSLSFFGFAARLQPGTAHSVVLTVDDTARRFRARPAQRPGARLPALVTSVSGSAAGELVAALRKGRKAEVATPAGRYDLPLSGSAKALDALAASSGCP
ncbi:hypothetical protein [Jiella avicenniae]|uniref:Invasion protein IalB, involved in pathogenesis n=1 Tax=Jiella avicenniae TaxID=2907202 RepID=A0A9X1NY84_9HYPH|nr:hypothetical protein [Jiella avicenniae]MCE7027098.1 hypothetical protein [Jiella avicenniae]